MGFHHQPPTESGREPLGSSGSCEPLRERVATSTRRRDAMAPPLGLAKASLGSPVPSFHAHYTLFIATAGWSAPLPAHRYFPAPARATLLGVFAWHRRQGSHVLCQNPDQSHAHSTSEAAKAVSRFRLRLSGGRQKPASLASSNNFRRSHGSLIAHFPGPHLTSSEAYSPTLRTNAIVPQQLGVLWRLLLQGAVEGPALISGTSS